MERQKLLLVDDTPENLQVLYRALRDEYEIFSATNGRKALQLAGSQRPDLILLDVMMPEMDGYQVCASLKDDPFTRDIPVIFITAKTDADSEMRALSAGAVDFIHKPFSTGVVRARVRLHLELVRHREHLEELVFTRTRELAEARDAAESASRAKSAFLSIMGHELRTPMNHIMGLGHLLAKESAGERAKELLSRLRESSLRLLKLINDILDFSQSEAEQIRIEDIDFDLNTLLNQAERGVREAASRKGVVLARNVDPTLPLRLRGDPVRLQQILGHLLGNGVKFSEQGEITVRVRRIEEHHGGVVARFEVEDQGIGIAPDVQAHLFQVFSQGDNTLTRSYGGSGIGLALSRRLVSLMAGEMGFSSIQGRGSTFWFSVRLAMGSEPSAGLPETGAPDWHRVGGAVAYLHHLLADDDPKAVNLWGELRPVLEPVLQGMVEEFAAAMNAFDFETALQMLHETVTAIPELTVTQPWCRTETTGKHT